MKRALLLTGLMIHALLTFAQASVEVKIDPIEYLCTLFGISYN